MTIDTSLLVVATPFQQSFIDPTTREPLIGSVYFYVSGTTTLKNVYSASGDPDDPYVATENPIPLNAAGALPEPILYYPYNESDHATQELYDIFVKDEDGVSQVSITSWPYSQQISSTSGGSDSEYIPNGQFEYPIIFYNETEETGLVTDNTTVVAWGWEYLTDADVSSITRTVTFSEVINADIEGYPFNECVVTNEGILSESISALQTLSLGPCTMLEGSDVTFSLQAYSESGSGNEIILQLVRSYGDTNQGASEYDVEDIATLTLTSEREKYVASYTVPSVASKTIVGSGSFSFRISFPLSETYIIAVTNISLKAGAYSNPEYVQSSGVLERGKIVGQALKFTDLSYTDNYAFLMYYNGTFLAESLTGQYALVDTDAVQPNMLALTDTAQSLPINGYNDSGVPYQNLYDVIGDKWGVSGSLAVSASGAVVTFTSNTGTRANSDYAAGDSGFTVTKITSGLHYGMNAELLSSNQILLTSADNYTASTTNPSFEYVAQYLDYKAYNIKFQNSASSVIANSFSSGCYYGYKLYSDSTYTILAQGANKITSTYTTGSSSTPWTVTLTFTSNNISDYKSYCYDATVQVSALYTDDGYAKYDIVSKIYMNHLQVPRLSNNTKGDLASSAVYYNGTQFAGDTSITAAPVVICISVDNKIGTYYTGSGTETLVIPFLSSETLEKNLQTFVDKISLPFKYTVTVTALPTAGHYFLYSSPTVDYYGWFTIDGVGVDPAVSSRTGVQIDLLSTDSVDEVATKIANTLNNLTFTVPSYTDIGYTSDIAENGKNVVVIYL